MTARHSLTLCDVSGSALLAREAYHAFLSLEAYSERTLVDLVECSQSAFAAHKTQPNLLRLATALIYRACAEGKEAADKGDTDEGQRHLKLAASLQMEGLVYLIMLAERGNAWVAEWLAGSNGFFHMEALRRAAEVKTRHLTLEDDLSVGIVADPESSPHWPAIEAFLQPAAARGNLTELVGKDELVWVVLDRGAVIGVATARLIEGGKVCEVPLVGGRDHRRWLKKLDEAIGKAAAAEGATSMLATGRKGWVRVLGWNVSGKRDGFCRYERDLGGMDVVEENKD